MLLRLVFWPFVILWTLIGGSPSLPNLIGSGLITSVQNILGAIF